MDMKKIQWDPEKNELLKKTRGISFEEIAQCKLIDTIENPSRKHQTLLLYEHNDYIWVVPIVETGEGIFMKTIYPNRKYTEIYLGGGR